MLVLEKKVAVLTFRWLIGKHLQEDMDMANRTMPLGKKNRMVASSASSVLRALK